MNFRRISEKSLAALRLLHQSRRFSWLLDKDHQEASIIFELGSSREPGLLPDLAGFALHPGAIVRTVTRNALCTLLSGVPCAHLLELDVFTREMLNHWDRHDDRWETLLPATVSRWGSKDDLAVLALASMHPNGHVREAAIRVLAKYETGAELPFILLRMNDWVAAIRELAYGVILSKVRSDYAGHFLRCLPLILRLEQCGRASHTWLIEKTSDLLSQSESASTLQAGLKSPDRNIRLTSLRFAVAANPSIAKKALNNALEDHDSAVRLWSARQLLFASKPDILADLYAELARDPFMPIRREGLNALVRCKDDGLHAALERALLDPNPSMRELSRFHLGNDFDPAAFYRDALESRSGGQLASAICGLGECGTENDANLVTGFLHSPEIRLRRMAVTALGRLAPEKFKEPLLRALVDESPGVSLAACRALLKFVHDIGIQSLRELLTSHPAPFVRKNALRLIGKLGKWEQIAAILAACRDPSDRVSLPAADTVRLWLARYNRSYATPSPTQISNAIQEFRSSREFLDSRTMSELEAIFSEWSGRD